ncbi:MAG TPA: DUF3149 domain-containing protein [Methylophilaceae bacterium]|nr:DUF3149 domain-containing protein [Methylophilaceae bacterium]HAJ72098.1 DUF3149 domain-containing protein [Methylophilaceae bacterium]
MKILTDLLSTDYGLMSLIVITVVLVAMTTVAIYVIKKSSKH